MVDRRRYYRSKRRSPGSGHGGPYENPRVDPQLKQTFRKIGIPEAIPFQADPFQLEALDRVGEYDVLVSAPTGSGKTWIASQIISRYLLNGLRTWYASPLKALSNSIYRQFCQEFGPEICGILTGDRKENAGAPVIVGTTEILRNQLYDAMHQGSDIQTDLVILDEAHYLSDPERGVVWEEVLIYLPSRVRLLLLSATISNAEEIATWLDANRRTKAWVVRSDERPVPLETLFLFPDGLISPLSGRKGLVPRVKKFLLSYSGHGGRETGRGEFGSVIRCLREFDLLPAIFFLKSRSDCDRALLSCAPVDEPYEMKERLRREVRLFLQKYPHLERHRQVRSLLESAVGSHHAGQLPYWKVLVEEMMNKGYLEAIFSTSTVAAGVNFPARTVVLVQSDRFDGHQFSDLTSTELHQMTGRAGRRGKDNIGFALVIPGVHQDPVLINQLKDSAPEPIRSQIHINFSMALNLLLSHTPGEIKDLLDRSFAAFQEWGRGGKTRERWEDLLVSVRKNLPRARCDTSDPFEIIEFIQKRREELFEDQGSAGALREERLARTWREYLRPGRCLLHKNGNTYVVLHTYLNRGRLVCACHNLRRTLRWKRGRLSLRKVELGQIKSVFDYRVEIPEAYTQEGLEPLLAAIPLGDLKVLEIPPAGNESFQVEGEAGKGRPTLPCEACEHLKLCHRGKKGELRALLGEIRVLESLMEGMGGGLWPSFKRHLRFLKETGFVDSADRLTADGIWASRLRLDHPLLIAEAIRRRSFEEASPETMAGCLAPFVWDRTQDTDVKIRSPLGTALLEQAFNSMLDVIEGIRDLQARRGFKTPPVSFWPAVALYLWAKGTPWDQFRLFIPVDEGDLASLIVRTADHLRQVANLEETHPGLALTARKAIDLILREPVFLD